MKKKSILISSLLTLGLFTASTALAAGDCPPTSQAFTCPQVSYSSISQSNVQIIASTPRAEKAKTTRQSTSTRSTTGYSTSNSCNTSASSENCNIIYGSNYSSLYGTNYDCNTSSSCSTSSSSATSTITYSEPTTTYSSSCTPGSAFTYWGGYIFNCR